MNTPKFKVLPDDAEWWCDEKFAISATLQPIRLSVNTEGNAPSEISTTNIMETLTRIDKLILAASGLILQNYCYDHFKSLGVNEKLLVKNETPEAIAKVVILREASFSESQRDSFELSFIAPWDIYHTFDVEFEDGEAKYCAVNG